MPRPIPQIDLEVVERAKRGDPDAHAVLYETFAPMIYTLARRMLVSAALAEDALQETFVEVIRNISKYRGDGALGHWIKRVAINRCLAHLRSPWSSRRVDSKELERAVTSSCDEQIALERALAELSATARAVVWLHDVEGFTHAEIATLAGRSQSFSKSQLARAHERLRASLDSDPEPERQPERQQEPEPPGGDLAPCEPALKIC